MRNKFMIAAVAAAALLATGIGFAQAPGGGMGPAIGGRQPMQGMRGPRGGLPQALDLTQEQRQQLQQLMQADREANREAAGKMPELQRQLRAAIFTGEGDVNALAQQINEAQAQLLQARIAHQQKVAAILTPEQREQMAKMPAGPRPMGKGRGRR